MELVFLLSIKVPQIKMKSRLTLLLCFFALQSQAQFGENHAIYMNSGFRAGNFRGIDANINYVYKEKNSFQFGWSVLSSRSANRPDNYNEGVLDLVTFGLTSPRNRIISTYFLVGKMIELNADQNIRLNFRIGPSWDMNSSPENFEFIGYTLFASNYIYEVRERRSLGLVIRPEIEFPFTRVFGVGMGTFFHVNKDFFAAGFEMNYMLGVLRKK